MDKHEYFTLSEVAEMFYTKNGVAGVMEYVTHDNLIASYILTSPWRAYYRKREEWSQPDKYGFIWPERKDTRRIFIELVGLIDLQFNGMCRNNDGSITLRGNGVIKKNDKRDSFESWLSPVKIRMTLHGRDEELHLLSTSQSQDKLQYRLNIIPERDLVVTRNHLEDFARYTGRSYVMEKLKTMPVSSRIAASEIRVKKRRKS